MTEVERATKRQRKDFEGYLFNLEEALVKEYENKSLGEIVGSPVSALQGVGPIAEEAFKALGIETVRDLAEWKFFKIAQAITVLVDLTGDKRAEDSVMNIDKAVMHDYEKKTLKDIASAPVDALEGLTKKDGEHLKALHVTTVEELGKLKYAEWASAILELSRYEVLEVVNRVLNNLK
eukprot:TRINITY_DN11968_c0_g1_i1.p2 TRINITY_DN11968_c0_g1~~TRINITY_DN11968_c0_g1_i1.p2  ORF type:complete len:178 (-),score=40.53 TRINITY_DN11968_c0_g1_i1:155-688(-)